MECNTDAVRTRPRLVPPTKYDFAYENLEKYFPKNKIVLTGNPVRSNINNFSDLFDKGIESFDLNADKKTMLVIGGSLGSREINKAIYSIQDYLKYINLQVIWQCGKLYYDEYKQKEISTDVKLYDFLDDIALAYSVSDFIISRAGASSVSELSIVGKPVIFIPSPNVAEDHQLKNAMAVVKNEGALLVEEKNIDDLKKRISELNSSSELRNKLSKNIKKTAYTNATIDIEIYAASKSQTGYWTTTVRKAAPGGIGEDNGSHGEISGTTDSRKDTRAHILLVALYEESRSLGTQCDECQPVHPAPVGVVEDIHEPRKVL